MIAAISASADLDLGAHGAHSVAVLLPTALLLLVVLHEMLKLSLDRTRAADPWLRRYLSVALTAAVFTALLDVVIALAALSVHLLTASMALVSAAGYVAWAIAVSRNPTARMVAQGLVGATAGIGLWSALVIAGPLALGAEVGNLLVWAPCMSGTVLLVMALEARRALRGRTPQQADERLVGARP